MTIVSHVTAEFRERYWALPAVVQRHVLAGAVTLDYRGLGYQENQVFYWFWIGPHDEYSQLLKRR